MMPIEPGDFTKAVHAGVKIDPTHGAVAPVIVPSTTYKQSAPGVHQGYDYSRADNPTRQQLEEALAELEKASYALSFASGLAAENAVLGLFTPGDHIIACDDVYGGTRRLFTRIWQNYGLHFHFLDLRSPQQLEEALHQYKAQGIWIESPTNPTLRVMDLEASSRLAKKYHSLLIVDNTFATPILQKPLMWGADIVLHSSTKYLGGHSDVVGGAVMTQSESLFQKLKFLQYAAGAVPSPFDCYLLLRSLPTLAIRMEKHCENALQVALFLCSHQRVEQVLYPGLDDHPQKSIIDKQMCGASGMVSFYLRGTFEEVTTFCQKTKLFVLAESLGSTKSMINHPARMTHASVDVKDRESLGISDNLLRLSIGLESSEDLIGDLGQALELS